MKVERQSAIRELVAAGPVGSQDELRRRLGLRGYRVTQATLSRDLHELGLFKGRGGYVFSNGNGHGAEEDGAPRLGEVLESFGLRVRQAMNQVVIGTVKGGAQPVAAALDDENWPGVLGTLAGDDTVLVICADVPQAAETQTKLRKLLGQ